MDIDVANVRLNGQLDLKGEGRISDAKSLDVEFVQGGTNPMTVVVTIDSNDDYVAVGRNGVIAKNRSDAGAVVNSAIKKLGTGTLIYFTRGLYEVKQKIVIPDGTKNVVFRGELVGRNRKIYGTVLDASENPDARIIENQSAATDQIVFLGVERLFLFSQDGILIDFSSTQDTWVRECFLLGGNAGLVPGNNCWIQNNWIEGIESGVRFDKTQIRGYITNNLFALNTNDIHAESGTMRAFEVTGNRSGGSTRFTFADGQSIEQSRFANIIRGTTKEGHRVDGSGAWRKSASRDFCDADPYFNFTNGGTLQPDVNLAPIHFSGSAFNGDPDHARWYGVVDAGPLAGGNLNQSYTAIYDGVKMMSNGSTMTKGDAPYSEWRWDGSNHQWIRVDGQATHEPPDFR